MGELHGERALPAGDGLELALSPILDDFGQDVVRLVTAKGDDSGVLRHVMKVFLIDAEGSVRNIYSAGFIDWRVVRNDILTLLEAERRASG